MARSRALSLIVLMAGFVLATCGGGHAVPKSQAYCHDILQEACIRAFDCVPPADRNDGFTAMYGTSVEQCRAKPDRCVDYPAQCPNFDPDRGDICLSDFSFQTCLEILFIQDGVPTIGLPGDCICPSTM